MSDPSPVARVRYVVRPTGDGFGLYRLADEGTPEGSEILVAEFADRGDALHAADELNAGLEAP